MLCKQKYLGGNVAVAVDPIRELVGRTRPFQKRARTALPLLVRRAQAGQPIIFETLAAELAMWSLNLRDVLRLIGDACPELSTLWEEKISHRRFDA